MSYPSFRPCGIDPDRRVVAGGLAASGLMLALAPAHAEPEDMARAILAFTGGRDPLPGAVTLDIAPLVENGNAVSLEIAADLPVDGANPVTELALFTEKNPQPEVAIFHLGPRAGRAHVVTRIRLATTQHVAALAKRRDGTCHIDRREVIVTIAACTEE